MTGSPKLIDSWGKLFCFHTLVEQPIYSTIVLMYHILRADSGRVARPLSGGLQELLGMGHKEGRYQWTLWLYRNSKSIVTSTASPSFPYIEQEHGMQKYLASKWQLQAVWSHAMWLQWNTIVKCIGHVEHFKISIGNSLSNTELIHIPGKGNCFSCCGTSWFAALYLMKGIGLGCPAEFCLHNVSDWQKITRACCLWKMWCLS